jgi:hypothetical protein
MTDTKKNTNNPSESLGAPFSSGSLDPFFEKKKNEFLAAVYGHQQQPAESIYRLILKRAENITGHLSETDEKYLRQIQVAFKKLTPSRFAPGSPKMQEMYQRLQSLIQKNVRNQAKKPGTVSYETWTSKTNLAPWQQEGVIANAITFQMTSGCSNYCRRCNEWALPKIRSHFTRQAAKTLLEQLIDAGNTDLALYGASDPLDWTDGTHTLWDILSGMDPLPGFSLLTKIPRGKEALLKILLKKNINLSVSMTDRNRSRIAALETQMNRSIPKQHASKDLLIPAGLDEDFISVKPSITDGYGTEITPEGACMIIPTFTSGLHPFGHKKLPITRETIFLPVKKIGRPALLVDYFKPLEVVGPEKKPYFLDKLLDAQVENLLLDNGSDALTPPGMRSLKEYFSIFDDTARRQRKKMIPSVIARLKQEFLPKGGYKTLSGDRKQRYRQRLKAHLEFCNRSVVAESKMCALSFFLAAAASFLYHTPVKGRIIAFLLRQETAELQVKYGALPTQEPLVSQFSNPCFDSWELFRFYATSLVVGRHETAVSDFITICPAEYDALADRFVRGHLPKLNPG